MSDAVNTVNTVNTASTAPAARPLRLGTRRSALAVTQSTHVADALRARGHYVEIVEIVTEGDVNAAPLTQIGGTGVFAAAIRRALLEGRIDLAVHSLKDLPVAPEPGLVVAAVPPRETPFDALVGVGGGLDALREGAVVGTGAPRRASQLSAARPDLVVRPVRGNVGTRLARVAEGDCDAVVLAAAGLTRLGLLDGAHVLDPDVLLPAPGQGALAVEVREDDAEAIAVVAELDDVATRVAVTAERSLLAALEAGCTAPVGALARIGTRADLAEPGDEPVNSDIDGDPADTVLVLQTYAGSDDGRIALRRRGMIVLPGGVDAAEVNTERTATAADTASRHLRAATALGREIAARLLAAGADAIPGTMRERSSPAPDLAPPEAAPAATDISNEQE